jgi:hypothetical protein
MMVFSGTRMLRPLNKGLPLLGATKLTFSRLMSAAGCSSVAAKEADLWTERLGATVEYLGDDLASISSRVRSSCSTRWPQPITDDKGPETPARVTTAPNRKTIEGLLATKSSEASLVVPTPAARAQTYPIHTAKLFFTP